MKKGIDVRQKLVTQFDRRAIDRGIFVPEFPRLFVPGPANRMRAEKRSENGGLKPSRIKLAAWTIVKSTNVAADKRHTRNTQIRQHRDRERELVPTCVVVAGPHCRESLHTGE